MRRFLQIAFVCALAFATGARAELLSATDQGRAQKIYNLKCSKCHEFYNPSDYSGKDWQDWMAKMKKKSHLNNSDYELLLRFTDQLREQKNTPVSRSP